MLNSYIFVSRKTNAAFKVEPSSEYKLLCWKQNYDCCCLLLPTHKTFRTLLQNYKATFELLCGIV